jgi:hypothetical protein
MVIKNADGTFSNLPAFDPVAAANTLVQTIASNEAQRVAGHAGVDSEANSADGSLASQLADILAAAALDPSIASQVQPILSACATQYSNAATVLTTLNSLQSQPTQS